MSAIDRFNNGRRVELVHTDDKWTKLKPGDKGTYEYMIWQPSGKHQHSIKWDDGSNLMLVQGIDKFRFVD